MKRSIFLLFVLLMFTGNIIAQPAITIGNINSCSNDTVLVPVSITNISNLGAMSIYITYDNTVLSLPNNPYTNLVVNVNPLLTIIGTFIYAPMSTPYPMAGIQWFSVGHGPLPLNTGILFYLKFYYTGSALPSTLNFNSVLPDRTELYDYTTELMINSAVTFNNGSVTQIPAPVAAGAINGPATVCQGTQSVLYNIPAVNNATTYHWNAPPGATITYGQGTTAIAVNFSNNAANGYISVQGMNSCGIATMLQPINILQMPVLSSYPQYIPILYGSEIVLGPGTPATGAPFTYLWSPANLLAPGNSTIQNPLTVPLFSPVIYTLTVTNSYGCNANTSITADPSCCALTVLNITASQNPVCPGYPVLINTTVIGGSGAYNYTWTSSPPGMIINPASASPMVVPSAPNTSYTYAVTVSDGNISATGSIVVSTNPLPSAAAYPDSMTICSGDTIEINLADPGNTPGVAFNWTASLISGAATGFSNGSGPDIIQTLINSGHYTSVVRYTITPADLINGCSGIPVNADVVVNPVPEILAAPASQTINSGSPVSIVLLNPNNIAGTTATWTALLQSGSAWGFSNGGGMNISQLITTPGNQTATVRYTATPNANGCTGFTITTDVRVLGFSLAGLLTYDNAPDNSPLSCSMIILKDLTDSVIQCTGTDANGYYSFYGIQPGSYKIEAATGKLCGSINSIDALLAMEQFTGIINLSGLRSGACDVNGNSYINATDALLIAERYLEYITTFPAGDWLFEEPQVSVSASATQIVDLRGICTGDVNASFIPPLCPFHVCGDTLLDCRDGQKYPTVQIGTQCWMQKNLNIGTMVISKFVPGSAYSNCGDNGIIEKYCYYNTGVYCDIYGGLYDWDEMMQYNSSPYVKGICPTGFHLPSTGEWNILIDYLGGNSLAGGKLKETGLMHWQTPNTGASNESGFTALASGLRDYSGSFQGIMWGAWFWSSSLEIPEIALMYYLNCNNTTISPADPATKMGYSVRCLRDQ